MNALYQQNTFSVMYIHFEQTKDILLVKLLPGPSMLAGMPILVSALQPIQFLSVLRKHLVIGQFSCSLFRIGQPTGSKPTGTDLITGSDKTVRTVHSCNS